MSQRRPTRECSPSSVIFTAMLAFRRRASANLPHRDPREFAMSAMTHLYAELRRGACRQRQGARTTPLTLPQGHRPRTRGVRLRTPVASVACQVGQRFRPRDLRNGGFASDLSVRRVKQCIALQLCGCRGMPGERVWWHGLLRRQSCVGRRYACAIADQISASAINGDPPASGCLSKQFCCAPVVRFGLAVVKGVSAMREYLRCRPAAGVILR
jgi:hypothetical protein